MVEVILSTLLRSLRIALQLQKLRNMKTVRPLVLIM